MYDSLGSISLINKPLSGDPGNASLATSAGAKNTSQRQGEQAPARTAERQNLRHLACWGSSGGCLSITVVQGRFWVGF